MKILIETAKSYLKKVFSDLHNVLVGIVFAAILSGGGIYLFFHNLWIQLKSIAQSPTPLWATIVLVLVLLVYIYRKSNLNNSSQPRSKSNFKTKYFTIGSYKWETTIYESGHFEVNKYPLCAIHDLRFIFGSRGKYCPGTENEKCINGLSEHDEFKVFESSKSIIDREVRKIANQC